MAKKSSIKSTSKKKKTAPKKKDDDKKPTAAQKSEVPKTKSVKKVKAKKKPVSTTQASAKSLSVKDLIFRKFDREIPEKLFKVEPPQRTYTAPAIISTTDDQEADRLKKLLFRKLDLTSPPEKPSTISEPEKPPVKTREGQDVRKADYKEIMARKFYQVQSPETLAESSHKKILKAKEAYTAPPLISTTDTKEAERLKKLLFRKMDLTSPPEKIEEPEETIKPEEVEAIEDEPIEAPVEEKEVKKADYKEIMSRKFHEPSPSVVMVEVSEKTKEDYTAPPLISTDDPKEAARIKEILFRQLDIPPSPVQPAVTPIEEKETEVKPAETVSETTEIGIETKEQPAPLDSEKSEAEEVEKEDKGPKATDSHDEPPPTDTEVSDPMDKMIKYVAAGVILILLLIIGYSAANKNRYYIRPAKDGIEILQGRFAPMGEDVIARLIGVVPPEHIKDVYKAEEVLPLAFAYFVDQADGILNTRDIPDLKAMKDTLDKALSFALTKNERDMVNYRLNSMQKHVMQYRANVAASRGTSKDVAIAVGILTDVLRLDMDDQQKRLIQSRIEYLNEYKNQLVTIEAEPDEIPTEADVVDQEKAKEHEPLEDEAGKDEKSRPDQGADN